jgi:hypothetical protein
MFSTAIPEDPAVPTCSAIPGEPAVPTCSDDCRWWQKILPKCQTSVTVADHSIMVQDIICVVAVVRT